MFVNYRCSDPRSRHICHLVKSKFGNCSVCNSNVISQLTGEISHLKLGVLKEGFGHPSLEPDVDALVRKAAERLGHETGATVEEVSVKMHLDGTIFES